jgi:hypothetical protein
MVVASNPLAASDIEKFRPLASRQGLVMYAAGLGGLGKRFRRFFGIFSRKIIK